MGTRSSIIALAELFKRKPYNITKTLDALKGVLLKEFRKRESEK